MANVYKCRPSTLVGICDPYTAFCFDEACTYIVRQIEDGKEPSFRLKFKSFRDMYKYYTNG